MSNSRALPSIDLSTLSTVTGGGRLRDQALGCLEFGGPAAAFTFFGGPGAKLALTAGSTVMDAGLAAHAGAGLGASGAGFAGAAGAAAGMLGYVPGPLGAAVNGANYCAIGAALAGKLHDRGQGTP